MTVSLRSKAGCVITLLILLSTGVGFTLGILVAKGIQKKKEDPTFWKQAAMKKLDELNPNEAQRKRFEYHTEQAVTELSDLRQEGIRRVWEVLDRALDDIEADLQPEQKETFEKIRPKPPESISK
ncbi:hypothetical protein WJU23_20345 [Prosthecobacter sp. SYSU 5D2]|uniref:hypothetical protein n=1 Tax=Prosthecobacter sp. SYSU 5D2 TaxID=3134134 RepID=UPI0031FF0C7C